jgi:hypothetical protein
MPETHEATLKEERDIVERLREFSFVSEGVARSREEMGFDQVSYHRLRSDVMYEAADLISQLRKRIGELESSRPIKTTCVEYSFTTAEASLRTSLEELLRVMEPFVEGAKIYDHDFLHNGTWGRLADSEVVSDLDYVIKVGDLRSLSEAYRKAKGK